jgi:hypothetical protein
VVFRSGNSGDEVTSPAYRKLKKGGNVAFESEEKGVNLCSLEKTEPPPYRAYNSEMRRKAGSANGPCLFHFTFQAQVIDLSLETRAILEAIFSLTTF